MKNNGFTLIFATNVWNHYQASICNALFSELGFRFQMFLYEEVSLERRQLGWPTGEAQSWIVGPPKNPKEFEQMTAALLDADVAVLCSCPDEVQGKRASSDKLTFVMRERLWKKKFHWWRFLNPRFARGVYRYAKTVNRPNVHYLPMGFYAADDARVIGLHGNRIWTWAYFCDVSEALPRSLDKQQIRILWAGRMLEWKRVDLLLRAVKKIAQHPWFSGVDIVGSGEAKDGLVRLAKQLELGGKCVFHEPKSPSAIRDMMRHADIYVLPSNRHEGWGVAANEAMAEGAVLVANEQAGAARVLLSDQETGFLFEDGNVDQLAAILNKLLSEPELLKEVRMRASTELLRLWSPREGAIRLISLINGLLGRNEMPSYREGPCSRC